MFKRNSLSSKSRKSPPVEPAAAANPLPAKSAIKSLLAGAVPPLSAAPLHFHHGKQQRPPPNPTIDDIGSDGSGSQASTSSNPSMQSSPARPATGPAATAGNSSFGSDDHPSSLAAISSPSSPGPQTHTIDAGRETLGWAPPVVLGASSTPHDPLASSTTSLETYSTAIEAIPDPSATPRPLAIKRPSLADVPSIFSPRLTSVASSTSSFFPTPPSRGNSLNLDFDPLTASPAAYSGPTFANGGPAGDGLPPPMTPARPGVPSRKSSVSALPRRTPQPMPIANLPTLPPITPASQPEDPMRTIRSMPRVLMTPSATPGINGARQRSSGYFPGPDTAEEEEDDEGGEAGDGDSDSDSDEEALTGERSSEDEASPASGTTSAGNGRRASISSISVDSINEESDDEEAHQMGSLPLDEITLNDIPLRRNFAAQPSPPLPLSDRRNIAQRPRLPPLATSSTTQAGGATQDRFVGLDWSLPTPSTESASAPEGAWATFSCPTPGGFTPISAGPTRPFAPVVRAKTPNVAEKNKTPRATGGEGGVSSYFEVVPEPAPEGGKTPKARTPAGLTATSTKGKGRQTDPDVTLTAVAGPAHPDTASSAETDTTNGSDQPSPSLGLGPAIAAPAPSEIAVIDDNDSDSDMDGDSGDSHDASPGFPSNGAGGADESFVMLAPPTPGARVPIASQEAFRPSLYHQASRSLINLSGPSDRRLDSNDLASSRDRLRGTMGKLEMPPTGPISAPRPVPADMRPSALPPLTSPKASSAVALTSPKVPSSPPPPLSPAVETRRVRRRNSMSDVQRPPPDYSPPGPGSSIPRPRDEEGKEKLPAYTCNVHIEGYLPRKTEFTSPGVQARDRAWKRQYFVLHGTCLKVYKHDIRRYPVRGPDGKEYLGESIAQVAQGAPHVHFPGVPAPEVRPPIVLASDASARRASDASRRSSDASSRRPSTSVPSRAPSEPPLGTGSRRGSVVDTSVRSVSGSSASVVPTSAASRTSSSDVSISSAASYSTSSSSVPETLKTRFDDGEGVVRIPRSSSVSNGSSHPGPKEAIAAHLPFHGSNQLVKAYSLQNAESGLAADYVKKKNVVRVRLGGEQFLMETGSPKEVVDWIEAFQAATNVALDLDERPMPKIITLPRRRRRRRPDAEVIPAAAAAAGAVVGDDDSPEANIRAAAAADPTALGVPSSGRPSAAVDSMERMLGEDQGQSASTV